MISVSTQPGQMQLTRIFGASSRANDGPCVHALGGDNARLPQRGDVEREAVVPTLATQFGERLPMGRAASVVDPARQGAELLNGGVGERCQRCGVSDVGRHCEGPSTCVGDLGGNALDVLGPPRSHDHRRAGRGIDLGDTRPDAGATAGHHHYLTGEVERVVCHPRTLLAARGCRGRIEPAATGLRCESRPVRAGSSPQL